MKKSVFIGFLILSVFVASSQDLSGYDSYYVDEFYEKVDLKYGTLDENGENISFVFVETEMDLENGYYDIQLSDGPGDLYQINGTDYYVTFRSYIGFVGYSEDCILKISGYSAIVYKE